MDEKAEKKIAKNKAKTENIKNKTTKKSENKPKETSKTITSTTPKSNQKKVTKVNVKVQTKTVKKSEIKEEIKNVKKVTKPRTENIKKIDTKKANTKSMSNTSKTKSSKKDKTQKETEKKENKKNQEIENLDKKQDEMDKLITQISSVVDEVEVAEKLDKNKNLGNESKEVEKKELVNPDIIKKNELETIKEEIKNNKKQKKSSEKKQSKYKELLKNNLIGIVVIVYFLALIIGKNAINTIEYITDLKVFVIIEAILSIIIIERAYKKDTFSIAIHGLEMLILGGSTVLILDLFNRQNDKLNLVFAILVGVFTLYYLIKLLVIAIKKDKKKK